MEIKEFMEKRKLSKDGNYYYAKENNRLFIQPVNMSKAFKIPKLLKESFQEIAIWEIGASGKTLHLNNLQVRE